MRRILALGLLLCGLEALLAPPAGAETYSTASALQAAIDSASEGGTITLDSGTVNIEKTIYITKGITLKGAGRDATILKGSGSVRVISCDTTSATSSKKITIQDLTIRDGHASVKGAGLYAENTDIVVENCLFTSNDVVANTSDNEGSRGGGMTVFISSDTHTAAVKDCLFDGNQVDAQGGGLWVKTDNSGVLDISVEDTTFKNNAATGKTFFAPTAGALYGWAESDSSLTLTVARCVFDGNTAFRSDLTRGEGGAMKFENGIKSDGAGTSATAAKLIMTDCVFSNNQAVSGGAVWLYAAGSQGKLKLTEAEITNCTFYNNTAKGSKNNTDRSFGGGGLMVMGYVNPVSAKVENCTFTGNTSNKRGGGLAVWGEFYNSSNADHGAVSMDVVNCTFAGNTVTDDASDGGAEIYNVGGAFTTLTNTLLWNSGSDYIRNSKITIPSAVRASAAAKTTLTLTNCAYASGALSDDSSAAPTPKAIVTLTAQPGVKTDVVSGDITHTVFKLTSADTDLIGAGTTSYTDPDSATQSAPTTDQLGALRKATPDIGATEYASLSISTSSLTKATVGTDYSVTLAATRNDAIAIPGDITWAQTGLPASLTLNASTGVISGTPVVGNVGTHSVEITATSGAYSDTKTLTLTVLEAFTAVEVTLTEEGNTQTSTITQTTASDALNDLGTATLSSLTATQILEATAATAIDFSGAALDASVTLSVSPSTMSGKYRLFHGSDEITDATLSVPSTNGTRRTYRLAILNRDEDATAWYAVDVIVYAPVAKAVTDSEPLELGDGEEPVEVVKMADQPDLDSSLTETTFTSTAAYQALGLDSDSEVEIIFATSKDVSYPPVEEETLSDLYTDIADALAQGGTNTKSGRRESLLAVFVPFRPVNSGVHVMGLGKDKLSGHGGKRLRLYVNPWAGFDSETTEATGLGYVGLAETSTGADNAATLLYSDGTVVETYEEGKEVNAAAYMEGGTVYNQYITADEASESEPESEPESSESEPESSESEPTGPFSGKGSSGGCDAGFGLLALALPALLSRRRDR